MKTFFITFFINYKRIFWRFSKTSTYIYYCRFTAFTWVFPSPFLRMTYNIIYYATIDAERTCSAWLSSSCQVHGSRTGRFVVDYSRVIVQRPQRNQTDPLDFSNDAKTVQQYIYRSRRTNSWCFVRLRFHLSCDKRKGSEIFVSKFVFTRFLKATAHMWSNVVLVFYVKSFFPNTFLINRKKIWF